LSQQDNTLVQEFNDTNKDDRGTVEAKSNFGSSCIKYLQARSFKNLKEQLDGSKPQKKYSKEIEDQLMKYNPDSELMMYNVQKQQRQQEIDEGFYFKIKQGVQERLIKFANNDQQTGESMRRFGQAL
jgi:thiamine biosynthesis lipoprotein ApbE